jgi:phospholipid transport system substrate-binding protein
LRRGAIDTDGLRPQDTHRAWCKELGTSLPAQGGPPETFTVKPIRVLAITLLQALIWLGGESEVAFAAPDLGPQEIMSDMSARLFAALGKESGATRHNAEKVRPLVDGLLAPHFDKDYTARLVLGLHWRSATPEQRQQFAAALYERLLRTYAGAVADWTPDRFKLLPLRADPAALQVTVHTQVTSTRGEIVPVDFRLHQTDEGWKVYDVTVDGVSYVRIYHDDTDTEIARKGLDGVIERLFKSDIGTAQRASTADPRGVH